MILRKDQAVSPVIGVLLMLVVTIIIAAVVSGFVGGLASDQTKAPQASISAKSDIISIQDDDKTNYVPNIPTGFTAANGILFEHKGGEGFDVGDIIIQLQSDDTKISLINSDTVNTTSGYSCRPSVDSYYIEKIGSTSTSDTFIKPGDKFKLVADSCYDASEGVWGGYSYPMNPCISWRPTNKAGGISLFTGTKNEYKIIDRTSQKVITEGSIILEK
jgi:archaeal type IV pilus assembly protein PilA